MITYSRRVFLGQGIVAAGLAAAPRRSLAALSANEQVNVGIVGCGWRGGQLFKSFRSIPGVRVAGLCDVDQERTAELAQQQPQAKRWVDQREMLDSPDIDAVVIANCNHWHCLSAIWALEAGKHIYTEKPLFHDLWEGRQLVNAVHRSQLICQVGTQQRSDPMQDEIKAFLHDDQTIGEVLSVRVNRFGVRKAIGKRSSPLSIPKTIDFDLWSGPAEKQAIYRSELHYDWHWDWNTGSGEMGNWGVHIVDDVRNNVFRDQFAFPDRVTAAGGRYAWDDAGNTPNLQLAHLETAGAPVTIGVCNLTAGGEQSDSPPVPGPGSGYTVFCQGGRLEGKRGNAKAFDQQGKVIRSFKGDRGEGHQRNFLDCIRNGDPSALKAPIEVGYHSTAWCNLANIATRLGNASDNSKDSPRESPIGVSLPGGDDLERMQEILHRHGLADAAARFDWGPVVEFDQRREQFVGERAAAANAYLRREARPSYTIPEISPALSAG